MSNHLVDFGAFQLDLNRRLLTRHGQRVVVGRRGIDILCALAASVGEPVAKDALLNIVWPGRFIGENNLHVHISALRKTLGTDGCVHLLTVPGFGYQLIAERPRPLAPTTCVSLIVDDFHVLTAPASQADFAMGLKDDLLVEFTGIPGLNIMHAATRAISTPCYRLDGSLRWSGAHLRATAHLYNDDLLIASERFDLGSGEPLRDQTELAREMALVIKGVLFDRHGLRLSAADQRSRLWHLMRHLSARDSPGGDNAFKTIDCSDPSSVFG